MQKRIQIPSRSEFISARHISNLYSDSRFVFQPRQSKSEPDFLAFSQDIPVGFLEVTSWPSQNYRRHRAQISACKGGLLDRINAKQNWHVYVNLNFSKRSDVDFKLAEIERHSGYRIGDSLNTMSYCPELHTELQHLACLGVDAAFPYQPTENSRDCHVLSPAALGGRVSADEIIPGLNEIIEKKSIAKATIAGNRRMLSIVYDESAPCNEFRAAFERSISKRHINFGDFSDVFLIPDCPYNQFIPFRLGPIKAGS